jgi:hypothetical protein
MSKLGLKSIASDHFWWTWKLDVNVRNRNRNIRHTLDSPCSTDPEAGAHLNSLGSVSRGTTSGILSCFGRRTGGQKRQT